MYYVFCSLPLVGGRLTSIVYLVYFLCRLFWTSTICLGEDPELLLLFEELELLLLEGSLS